MSNENLYVSAPADKSDGADKTPADVPTPVSVSISCENPAEDARPEEALIALPHVHSEIPTDVPSEEAEKAFSPEIMPMKSKGETDDRLRLVFLLVCTVSATLAVIVFGVLIAEHVSRFDTPLPEVLFGEVFGAGVSSLGGSYVRPPLTRIPPQTVPDGELPGAAEQETVTVGDSSLEAGKSFPVKEVDLSVTSDDIFAIINETPYTPDVMTLYAEEAKIPSADEIAKAYGKDAPVVLILHTHGTESYLEDGSVVYKSDETFRSYDTERNVVAVGKAIADRLREHGIGVLHLTEMFDAEDYNSAYYLAAAEISRLTEKHPSISYVFDIHRDAMITAEGVNLKPTSPLAGADGAVAQMMLVVGTDHAGSGHTEWEDNLSLALKLQRGALKRNGGVMRALNLRSASFNEQYTKGSLLLEVGAAGNSLPEAIRAAIIFADAAAEVINGK